MNIGNRGPAYFDPLICDNIVSSVSPMSPSEADISLGWR